jgi:hypothetical protein
MNKNSNHSKSKRSRRQNRRKTRKNKSSAATAIVGRSAIADQRFNVPLFSPRFRMSLVYSETSLSVSSSAGSATTYFFSANGLFDPNTTGTGHQPMGFDQMMLMYEQYTVISSKISVQFINSSGANVYNNVGIYLSPDTTNIVVPSRLIENGQMVWKTMSPTNQYCPNATLSLNCNIATYFGRNRNQRALLDDDNLFGTVAANPSEQVYYGLITYDPTLVANTSADFTVIIEYHTIFWEPRKLTQS